MLHGNELPLNQNLVYCLSPTAALEQSLKAIWDAVSQGAVLILAQIKLNSQLSSYTSFLSQHYSSLLAWKIPWMEEPGRLHSMGSLRVGHNWATSLYFSLLCIGEGNVNPLQCSCLENLRDGGAWWASIYGVAQSRTWLKWFISKHVLTAEKVSWDRLSPLFWTQTSSLFQCFKA